MAENPRGEEVNAEIAAEEANKLSDLLPGPGDTPVPQVPNVAPTLPPGMPQVDPQALQDGVQNAPQAIQQTQVTPTDTPQFGQLSQLMQQQRALDRRNASRRRLLTRQDPILGSGDTLG